MKISNREIEILDYLMGRKATFKSVAITLGIKKSNLTKYIKKLERYRLVTLRRDGQHKEIHLEYAIWFGFFGVRQTFPEIKLKDILIGRVPFLLSFIKNRQKFRIRDLDIPAVSAKKILSKLRKTGIIFMPTRGVYSLREEALPAAEFCRDVLMQMYVAEGEHEMEDIKQVFFSFDSVLGVEVVFVTGQENSPKNYWLTSYSVFHKYGIDLILAGKYYYTNIKPDLEDIIIHTLALSRDIRSIAYVASLMFRHKFSDKLLKKKQRFGLKEEFITKLIQFVESKNGKTFEGFPSWEEVEAV